MMFFKMSVLYIAAALDCFLNIKDTRRIWKSWSEQEIFSSGFILGSFSGVLFNICAVVCFVKSINPCFPTSQTALKTLILKLEVFLSHASIKACKQ